MRFSCMLQNVMRKLPDRRCCAAPSRKLEVMLADVTQFRQSRLRCRGVQPGSSHM